jgi:sugar lactone lactonase YvrE
MELNWKALFLGYFLCCSSLAFPQGIILTVAGNGVHAGSDENIPALQASLYYPNFVAVTDDGTFYFTEAFGFPIKKVSPDGVITNFAGNGLSGFAGDGGPATEASFNDPQGIVFDKEGNAYIADNMNYRVRKIDKAGIVTTYAGNGSLGTKGDGGPAINAELGQPLSLVFDSNGNLYVGTTGRVRKISSEGIITTVVGGGKLEPNGVNALDAKLSDVSALALDNSDSLYILDFWLNRLFVVKNGIISYFAGTGLKGFKGEGTPAINAAFDYPWGLAIDGDHNVYVGDTGNSRVRKITPDGIITTLAGGKAGYYGDGGPSDRAGLFACRGLAFDKNGNLYVVDNGNDRIRKIYLKTSPPNLKGDVNLDNKANVQDVIIILRWIAGVISLDDTQQKQADFSGDGKIDILDAAKLLRKVAMDL